MMFRFCVLSLVGLLCVAPAPASEPLQFENPAQEARFLAMTQEFRCLVCQNQNLADSDAPLAQDLRVEIHQMLIAGRSDDEIKAFLVDRYGDFVLYRPEIGGNTLLLWVLPLALLLGGFVVIILAIRRRKRIPATTDEEQFD